VSFTKSVSLSQGAKLQKFADLMLIRPLEQVTAKISEQKRSCKKYGIDHTFRGLFQ